MVITVYHWSNGAYVNSYDEDMFIEGYAELYAQYGSPDIAITEVREE